MWLTLLLQALPVVLKAIQEAPEIIEGVRKILDGVEQMSPETRQQVAHLVEEATTRSA